MAEEKWYKIRIISEGNNGINSLQEVANNIDADRLKFWVQESENISSADFDLEFQGTSLNANLDANIAELGIVEGSQVILIMLNDDDKKKFKEVCDTRRQAWIQKMQKKEEEENAKKNDDDAPNDDDE